MFVSYSIKVNSTFKNTLGLLPNGVLIINLKTKNITFANKEMMTLVMPHDTQQPVSIDYSKLKEKVC